MLNLYAERDAEYQHIATVARQEEAAVIVHSMQAAGTWPEGHDAILRQEWYLVEGSWESL